MGLNRLARRVVFILCLVVGLMFFMQGSASATASPTGPVGGNDYPWQGSSLYGMSPLRFANRNCTDYVAFELNKQLGGSLDNIKFDWSTINAGGNGNASAWARGADGKFTVNDSPQLGAVAWWNGSRAGGYGHVALVTALAADGSSVTVDEYNTDMAGHFRGGHVLTRGESGWPTGFIHVADVYADGTYLNSDSGKSYVVVGGAPMPADEWHMDGPHVAIAVLQHQVDIMPAEPRDGVRVRKVADGMEYVSRQGKLEPADPHATTEHQLVSSYLSPELAGSTLTIWQSNSLVQAAGARLGLSGTIQ